MMLVHVSDQKHIENEVECIYQQSKSKSVCSIAFPPDLNECFHLWGVKWSFVRSPQIILVQRVKPFTFTAFNVLFNPCSNTLAAETVVLAIVVDVGLHRKVSTRRRDGTRAQSYYLRTVHTRFYGGDDVIHGRRGYRLIDRPRCTCDWDRAKALGEPPARSRNTQ